MLVLLCISLIDVRVLDIPVTAGLLASLDISIDKHIHIINPVEFVDDGHFAEPICWSDLHVERGRLISPEAIWFILNKLSEIEVLVSVFDLSQEHLTDKVGSVYVRKITCAGQTN